MPTRWRSLVARALVIVAGAARAHRLPSFPQVPLLRAVAEGPRATRVTVEVRDPAGTEPVLDARVTTPGLHAAVGSGLRVEPVPLEPAEAPGTYEGILRFPAPGRWALTIDVVGRHMGDAHVVVGDPGALGRLRALAPRHGRGPDRCHAPAGAGARGHLGRVRHRRGDRPLQDGGRDALRDAAPALPLGPGAAGVLRGRLRGGARCEARADGRGHGGHRRSDRAGVADEARRRAPALAAAPRG